LNNNERELERAGYDNWKLSNRDDEIRTHKGRHTFVTRTKLGVCPCCTENVYDNQLFVEEDIEVFHYSCYNDKKANEDNER
jgi:hypothetical protein